MSHFNTTKMTSPTDKRFQQLSLAISKAINSQETPVKEKHVRSTIIGSFQEQGAVTYWVVAIRQPLQDNRITAWKFCHVTHKLLREGHPACLDDSQRHIGMIENLGKLWVHLREGYGKLISLYTALLAGKLRFHARNPQLPGNMAVSAEELDAIAENDVNNYFQLCVELFDYMDDILNLQSAVFDSLGNARANSMTASGQCRLAALIPCAQDSSHIYDCNVRLLFRLHAALPPDTLAGHRERFRQQFKKLSAFYKHASTMQYFRNLLTLPQLPNNPPNFLIQSDFGTYVAPVVMIPEPQMDETDAVASLIDTSDTMSQMTSQDFSEMDASPPSPQPDLVLERDRLIEHLQSELKRHRSEINQLVQERSSMLGSMREHCSRLEADLEHAKSELEEEKQKAELITALTPEITQKLNDTEERARVTDEKFQKLKGAYTQLREEHIGLIRQKAEVDKMAATLRSAAAEHESAKVALQQQLNDRSRDVELLQQTASTSEAITNELETLRAEILNLRVELTTNKHKELEFTASIEQLQQEHKSKSTETQEQIRRIEEQAQELNVTLEKTKREKIEKENEAVRLKEEIALLKDKNREEFKTVVEEKEAAVKQVAALVEQFQQEKQESDSEIEQLNNKIKEMEDREKSNARIISNFNAKVNTKCNELETLIDCKEAEISGLKNEITELQQYHDKYAEEIANLKEKLQESCNENEIVKKSLDLTQEAKNNLIQTYQENQEIIEHNTDEIESLKDTLRKMLGENQNVVRKMQEELLANADKTCDLQEKIRINNKELAIKSDEIVSLKEIMQKLVNEKEEIKNTMNQKVKNNEDENKYLQEKAKEYKDELSQKVEELKNINNCLQVLTNAKETFEENMTQQLNEKFDIINNLDTENKRLINDLDETKSELIEREAELEITKNEFLSLKSEHEVYVQKNENDLTDRIELLDKIRNELLDIEIEKQNLQSNMATLDNIIIERDLLIDQYKSEIEQLKDDVNNKIVNHNQTNKEYEERISQGNFKLEELTSKLEETLLSKDVAIQSKEMIIKEYEDEKKNWENKFDYSEKERLTAECELQDLLQHNTSLEENLGTMKSELQLTKEELERQRACVVECVALATLELITSALTNLERASSQESCAAAADLAAQAFADLAQAKQIKGNERVVAHSAISAAHNAAQLATHTSEVITTVTDVELADKLTGECRTMLNLSKQCMEALAGGVPPDMASDAMQRVQALAKKTSGAAQELGRGRCVDDELADMDRAIEEAAGRIEEMLATSRSADSGVKLEVNNKILDACTTLMGAVKVLVQDARKLQNELGDPKTRQKMYRRNPQWSEGLISAAKAVVVAAKMLVTSADEAVSGHGAIEGVSAASHEVAGSTAQLVAASRARAPPASPALAALTHASRNVAAATGAVVAAVRAAGALVRDQEDLETSALTLTAARRLEMESKVRSLELESALDAERARLAVLRRRHYQLAQQEENGNITNGGGR